MQQVVPLRWRDGAVLRCLTRIWTQPAKNSVVTSRLAGRGGGAGPGRWCACAGPRQIPSVYLLNACCVDGGICSQVPRLSVCSREQMLLCNCVTDALQWSEHLNCWRIVSQCYHMSKRAGQYSLRLSSLCLSYAYLQVTLLTYSSRMVRGGG
jgi:hypothetical protein